MILQAKYQGSRSCGFRQVFPIQTYVKHVILGWGHFWPQGLNLNKLGRGSLGDATYQISSFFGLSFQTGRFFFTFSRYKPMLNMFVCCLISFFTSHQ